MKAFCTRIGIGLLLLSVAAGEEPDFLLQRGDTVVFLGDSITAAQTYGKLVEIYTLLRFPEREIRFFNVGKGGDTAEGGLARLERDVFPLKPTVLTVACGYNDIGWGFRADAEHKQRHLDAIKGIILACRERNIRTIICSPAITAAAPDEAESGFFQALADEAHALAKSLGAATIDVQRPMREIQRRILEINAKLDDAAQHTQLHAADGVHLNDLGQLAMAYAILKGLNAPMEVSSAHLVLEQPDQAATSHCRISDIRMEGDALSFTRLDERLPFNVAPLYQLNYRFVPVPSELNRYDFSLKGLKAGRYRVSADGRSVGVYTADQLARGVNLASATTDGWHPGGPWAIQAHLLYSLTNARNDLGIAWLHRHLYQSEGPLESFNHEEWLAANAALERLQRDTARPRPYRFTVSPEKAEENRKP